MPEYDYEAQKWVDDPDEAARLRREQLERELRIIESPRGEDYLRLVRRNETPEQAAAKIRAQLD